MHDLNDGINACNCSAVAPTQILILKLQILGMHGFSQEDF